MKLVVISILNPFASFVVGELARRFALQCVIQPVWTVPARTDRWSRLKRSPFKTLKGGLDRRLYNLHRLRLDRQTCERLYNAPSPPAIDQPVIQIPWGAINDPDTIELLRSYQPDLMMICCAPILKPAVFTIPRLTINVHQGISPRYRGENTLFWPLYFQDYKNLGVTIHEINACIDGGAILAQGFPALNPDDTEAAVIAKCAQTAAELIVDIASIADNRPVHGEIQRDKGRLFLTRDWTPWKQCRYEVGRAIGRRLPQTAAHRWTPYLQSKHETVVDSMG